MTDTKSIGKRFLNWWEDYFKVLKNVFKGLANENITILASGLVYSTLIAVIPCLTFLFTFLSSFGALQVFLDVLNQWLSNTFGSETASSLILEVNNYSSNAMSLGVVGLISFLIAGLLLVNKIYNVINQIFKARTHSGSLKRFGTFFIFLIVFTFLISLAFALSNTLLARIDAYVNNIEMSVSMAQHFRKAGSFVLIWFTLFLFLVAVPNIKVRKRSAAVGATTGLIFISIVNIAFNTVVSKLVGYWTIYGTVASVFMVLLYFYILWYIIIAVAEIVYIHQFRPDRNTLFGIAQSPSQKIGEAVNLLVVVCSKYKKGEGASSIREICKLMNVPYSRILTYLREFEAAGYIIPINSQNTAYIPSKPLDSIFVKDVVAFLYGIEELSSDNIENIGDTVSAELFRNGEMGLSSLTIENLLERI